MSRFFFYFLFGYIFVVLQSSFFPEVLPYRISPDLLLALVIYIGLNERYLRGGILTFFLGALSDVFSGHALGLNATVFLLAFLTIRGIVDRLNTESSFLILFLVAVGTLFQGGILIILLTFLAETGNAWILILKRIPLQIFLNVSATWLLLMFLQGLQRRFFPRHPIPGFKRLDECYEP